eukprot:TRINITY_DN69603_c0_g1_i1.p1 TRINITY_DN69603_c0_g1~~TRINITY_DN69603_c0_g1_i1.p1  ORF type:complete len:954 (-),score=202.13 TRINITY_DN69603_c0_g1_i1:30-2891(-)
MKVVKSALKFLKNQATGSTNSAAPAAGTPDATRPVIGDLDEEGGQDGDEADFNEACSRIAGWIALRRDEGAAKEHFALLIQCRYRAARAKQLAARGIVKLHSNMTERMKYVKKLGQPCERCRRRTLMCCPICSWSFYCSQTCIEVDRPRHQDFCELRRSKRPRRPPKMPTKLNRLELSVVAKGHIRSLGFSPLMLPPGRVFVLKVKPWSWAAWQGILPGDEVVQISCPRSLEEAAGEARHVADNGAVETAVKPPDKPARLVKKRSTQLTNSSSEAKDVQGKPVARSRSKQSKLSKQSHASTQSRATNQQSKQERQKPRPAVFAASVQENQMGTRATSPEITEGTIVAREVAEMSRRSFKQSLKQRPLDILIGRSPLDQIRRQLQGHGRLVADFRIHQASYSGYFSHPFFGEAKQIGLRADFHGPHAGWLTITNEDEFARNKLKEADTVPTSSGMYVFSKPAKQEVIEAFTAPQVPPSLLTDGPMKVFSSKTKSDEDAKAEHDDENLEAPDGACRMIVEAVTGLEPGDAMFVYCRISLASQPDTEARTPTLDKPTHISSVSSKGATFAWKYSCDLPIFSTDDHIDFEVYARSKYDESIAEATGAKADEVLIGKASIYGGISESNGVKVALPLKARQGAVANNASPRAFRQGNAAAPEEQPTAFLEMKVVNSAVDDCRTQIEEKKERILKLKSDLRKLRESNKKLWQEADEAMRADETAREAKPPEDQTLAETSYDTWVAVADSRVRVIVNWTKQQNDGHRGFCCVSTDGFTVLQGRCDPRGVIRGELAEAGVGGGIFCLRDARTSQQEAVAVDATNWLCANEAMPSDDQVPEGSQEQAGGSESRAEEAAAPEHAESQALAPADSAHVVTLAAREVVEFFLEEDVRELGCMFQEIPSRKAVVVRQVYPLTWAASNGLRPGDELVQVGYRLVRDMEPHEVQLAITKRPQRLVLLPA